MVVDQGEEEFEVEEVKMDQAWTFLTSSALSDLSLLREGFQGKNSRRVNISMLLVTGSHVSDSRLELLWVFCHPSGQAVCYRTPEKPSLVLHCTNKDIS